MKNVKVDLKTYTQSIYVLMTLSMKFVDGEPIFTDDIEHSEPILTDDIEHSEPILTDDIEHEGCTFRAYTY